MKRTSPFPGDIALWLLDKPNLALLNARRFLSLILPSLGPALTRRLQTRSNLTFLQQITDTTELKESDVIKLGVSETIFKLTWKPFVVCFSTVESKDKAILKKKVKELGMLFSLIATREGGQVVADWTPEVTVLMMSNLEVTVKVLHCLINGKHLVGTNWLRAIASREGLADPWPEEEEYDPTSSYLLI